MIEVNEYVKTDNGKITKIIGIDEFIDSTTFYETEDNPGYMDLCNKNIVKHSKELIDLVEVGDYVNGYRVINVINEGPCPSGKCVDIDSSKDSSECTLWEEDIETILTHEQFEQNSYKVGGEDE